LKDLLCFIGVAGVLSNEFCRSLCKIDEIRRSGDPLRARESRRDIVEICCDSMDRLAAFDRVWTFMSDHSGKPRSNEFSRRFGTFAPSKELNELFCFIVGCVLFIELCIGGDKSNEFRLSGNSNGNRSIDVSLIASTLSIGISPLPLPLSVNPDIGVR